MLSNSEIIATSTRLLQAWGMAKPVELTKAEQRAFGHVVETREGYTAVTKPMVLLASLQRRGIDVSWAADFGLPV